MIEVAGPFGGADTVPEGLGFGPVLKGRYRVLEELGAGRWGRVYLAERLDTGDRIALRVLRRELSEDQEFVRRFHAEASRIVARSKAHRNLVVVSDCDRTEDGSLLIATEYLDGQPLSDLLRSPGALEVDRALRLAVQIGEAIEAAHNMGLVLGDLGPERVMLVGSEERVKLLGVELAGFRGTAAVQRLARAGILSPTPEYMAPEQTQGGEITERTDVYAFGAMLYRMLSGVLPFDGSSAEILEKQLKEAPVPLRKRRSEVPAAVERAVMQALEKKAERRPRDISALVNEFWMGVHLPTDAEERQGKGTAPAPVLDAKSAPVQPRRHKGRWGLVGVGGGLVAVAILAAWIAAPWIVVNEPGGAQRSSRATASRVEPTPEPTVGGRPEMESAPPGGPVAAAPDARSSAASARPASVSQATDDASKERKSSSTAATGSTEGVRKIRPATVPATVPPATAPAGAGVSPPREREPAAEPKGSSGVRAADVRTGAETSGTPRQQRSPAEPEEPDPGAIIDWLLRESPAARE